MNQRLIFCVAGEDQITTESQIEAERLHDDAAAWLREADHHAARRLMDALYPQVVAIVRTRLPRRIDEEDLAQEVFVRFFDRLHTWDGRAPLKHWLGRLAVNVCIDRLRSEARRPELRLADLTEDEAEMAAATLSSQETRADDSVAAVELAEKLLATLEPEEQMILRLMDMEGRSSSEIEQMTGWSRIKIRVRAFRARRKLRKQLMNLGASK